MKAFHLFFETLLIVFLGQATEQKTFAQQAGNECGARIGIEVSNSLLTISGNYRNNTNLPVYYYYELNVTKKNSVNSSNNLQSGRISVQPGVETVLSTSKINYTDSDVFEIELHIINEGKIICTQKTQFPQSTKNQ